MAFVFPDPNTTPEFTAANGVVYAYDNTDGKWVVKSSPFQGDYVKKTGGDSMQGPLQVSGPRSANADGLEGTVKALNIDSGQNSSLNLKWNGATKVYVGDDQTSFQGDIKFNVGGRAIYAGNDKKAFVINDGGVFYDGAYSNDRHVATKKNVDEAIYHDILDTDTNKYVDRAGDSMSGPLVMDDTEVRFNNRSDGETLIRAGRNEGEYPMLFDLRNPGGSVAGGYDIKIQGNTAYNQLRFVGNDTYLTMNGGGGAKDRVMFNIDISLENNRIENLGRAVNDDDATNKQYVDERDELLRQDIIELEEEIDAIAPSLEYGTWKFEQPASESRPPASGTFFLLNNTAFTDKYEETTAILIHNDEYVAPGDTDPVDNHTWADADVDELIQLFDAADPDFFLGKITAKTIPGDYVILTVDRIQSSGVPNDNADPITKEYLTRINIFKEPSGGNASEFVLKSGDTMSDDLAIDKGSGTNTEATLTLTGSRTNTTNAAATIAFENSQSPTFGYLTYRSYAGKNFFKFNQDLDLGSRSLTGVSDIEMTPGGSIGSSTNKRLTFHNATSGNDGDGLLVVPRPAAPRRGFVIRGNTATDTEQDILFSFTNSSGPDAVNYVGKMSSDTNLVNKGYVDSQVAGGDRFKPDYAWNEKSHAIYNGNLVNWTSSLTFPQNEYDIVASDINGNKLSGTNKLDKIRKIAYYPPGGTNGRTAGYMGILVFGESRSSFQPLAIFQVITQERSTTYWAWHCVCIYQNTVVSAGSLSISDLNDKSFAARHGAVYVD